MEYLVSDVVIFDWICQLVSSIPGVEEPSRSARPVTRILYNRDHHSFVVNINPTLFVSYFSGIISEHCCVSEWICEWQLYLQHLMGVQIQGQSDLSVTSVSPVLVKVF